MDAAPVLSPRAQKLLYGHVMLPFLHRAPASFLWCNNGKKEKSYYCIDLILSDRSA